MDSTRKTDEHAWSTPETMPHDAAIEEFPLKVVPDWDERVRTGERLGALIDRHVEYEARGRMLDNRRLFRPRYLCPEQRVQLLTDLYVTLKS